MIHISDFWKSRTGILLQIVIILIPSAVFLRAGKLLLPGMFFSVALSWIGLRLQKLNWTDLGLKRPDEIKKIILTVIVATPVLIIFSYELRLFVTYLTNQKPDLEAFQSLKGNPKALLVGLFVVWIFGAFGEELLFRGFFINAFFKIFPSGFYSNRIKWGLSLLLTSVLVGLGHAYQGITGMILTGIMGFCFGLIYLSNKRNLWPSILIHGMYDTIAFIFVYSGFSLNEILK